MKKEKDMRERKRTGERLTSSLSVGWVTFTARKATIFPRNHPITQMKLARSTTLLILTLCNYCLVRTFAIEIRDREPYGSKLSKHFNLLPVTTLTRPVTVLKPSCSKLSVYIFARVALYYILYDIRGKLYQNMSIVNRHPLFLGD